MARKFFIARCKSSNGKYNLWVLLEDLGIGPLINPVDKLIGGETNAEAICRELVKIKNSEKKNSRSTVPFAGRVFSVSNLLSDTITVDADSSLMFLRPLTSEEMENFYACYFKVGQYV